MLIRTAIAALLAVANLAAAEPDPAAKAKLQAAADALKAAKSLSYSAILKGEGGMFATFVPHSTTKVLLQRHPENPKTWLFRVEGTAKLQLPGQEPVNYLVVGDGTRKAWKDEGAKQVIERFNAAAGGPQVDMATKGAGSEILESEPLVKELGWPTLALEGEMDVEGVKCDVVKADDGKGDRPRRFFIAQSDHLPRRIEHWVEGGNMHDAEVWTLTEIKVDGPVPAGSFAISTPEGWAFSPATPPPAPTPAAPKAETNAGGTTTSVPLAPRQRAVGVNAQDLAPDFELASGTGEKVKLSSLHDSVVVLDFWGTWCLPCKKASPELQKLVEDYKTKPVKAFGLAVRETSDEKPIAYMKEGNYTYGLLLKADEVAKLYRVKAYPTYFVIGKSGEIVYSVAGYDETTFPAIRRAVDAALEGKPMPKEEVKPAGPNDAEAAHGDDRSTPKADPKGPAKADPKGSGKPDPTGAAKPPAKGGR